MDNEHQKWSKAIGGRSDVAVPVAALVTAFISGCGWSNHHDQCGVFPDEEYASIKNAQQFQSSCSKVLKMLPSDVANWRRTRVGDGGPHPYPTLESQHWTFSNIGEGVSRAFAAVNGDRFVMSLTGVRGSVMLNESHSDIEVVSLRDGETVYAGNGPVKLTEAKSSAFLVTGTN